MSYHKDCKGYTATMYCRICAEDANKRYENLLNFITSKCVDITWEIMADSDIDAAIKRFQEQPLHKYLFKAELAKLSRLFLNEELHRKPDSIKE